MTFIVKEKKRKQELDMATNSPIDSMDLMDLGMKFFNPDNRVLFRVNNCIPWFSMKRRCGLLETGTLMKLGESAYASINIEYQENRTIMERLQRCSNLDIPNLHVGPKIQTTLDWDTLKTGDRVEWWKKTSYLNQISHFLFLGHVVFPWYPMKMNNSDLVDEPTYYCIQIWMPFYVDGNNNNGPGPKGPFARNFFQNFSRTHCDIIAQGTGGIQVAGILPPLEEASEEEYRNISNSIIVVGDEKKPMDGLEFEVVDRTLLSYQPNYVKQVIEDLKNWKRGS